MPAPQTDPPRGGDDKAAREPQAPAAAAAPPQSSEGGGWKAWLPLLVAIIVMPGLAYAVTTFVLVPKLQKSLRAAGAPVAEAATTSHAESPEAGKGEPGRAGQRQTVALSKLLVNVAGTMGSRYLLASLTLVGDVPDFSNRIAQNEPQLRDVASGLLNTKTIADLEKPGARNMIRSELITSFNSILGNAVVQEIYFTDFAIQ